MKHKNKHANRVALALTAALAGITIGLFCLVDILFDYQQTIVKQEEQQMLTVAKSVADNIYTYTNGYLSDMTVLRNSSDFADGWAQYAAGGPSAALEEVLQGYADVHPGEVTGLCLVSYDGNCFAETDCIELSTGSILHNTSNQMFYLATGDSYSLGIAIPCYQKAWLICLLDIQDMYQRIGSDIRLGQSGFVMIKASDGTVLMHKDTSYVGKNLLTSTPPAGAGPDVAKQLQLLNEKQTHAETGVDLVSDYSYTGAEPVVRVTAYTPSWLRNDFLIVSAVSDYDEIMEDTRTSLFQLLAAGTLTLASITVLLILAYVLFTSRRRYAEENQALRQLNSTLEELHQQEEKIQHSQRLQIIGTMTSGIAHEFNNLLTPIMGYSGMLMAQLDPKSEEYDDLNEIYTASTKAKEIIQQITTLSRKSIGHTFKNFELDELLRRTIKIVRSTVPGNVTLSTDIELGDITMLGSETQLSQVILNLCVNAFHAIGTKEGGSVAIRARLLPAAEMPPALNVRGGFARYARLDFTDNGCGIEPRFLDRVFDPFFTTKKAGEGTGLGLSTAQSIVDSHGGAITVDSTVGKGTTFTLYLPVSNERPTPAERPAPAKNTGNLAPIVVVDNDDRIVKMLDKGLRQLGFEVAAFDAPVDALEYLKAHPTAALVADYSMPGMTGAQLALRVRSARPGVRILILTGLIEREIVEFKHKGIIDDYILKPVLCQEVAEKLSGLLA